MSESPLSLSRSQSGIAKEEWIGQQVKTFTRWVNDHLKKCPVEPIKDISTDFDDGVRLVMLLCSLYDKDKPNSFTMTPRNIYAKRENINAAFGIMTDVGIRLPVTQVGHITEHNLKMILGMIWVIILHFNNKRIHELHNFQIYTDADDGAQDNAEKQPPMSPSSTHSGAGGSAELKRILLKWANKSLNKRDMNVTRFTDEWRDGMAFLTIINDHDPTLIPDYDTRTPENREDNLEVAFSAAEKLGASRLLYVEDMVGPEKLDENSVVTYVAELHTAILEDKNRRAEELAKIAHEAADKVTKDAQSQVDHMQQKLDDEANKNQSLLDELENLRKEKENDEKVIEETKGKLDETQQKLDDETSKNQKLTEEINAAKSAQEEAEKVAKESQNQITQIQQELEEERKKNEKLLEELNAAKKEEVKEEVKEEIKEELKEEVKEEVKEEKKEEEKKEEVKEEKKEEEKKEEVKEDKKEDEFDFMHSLAILIAIITSGLLPLWLAIPSYAILADRIIQEKFPYLKDNVPAATRKLMTFGIVAFNLAVAMLSGGGGGSAPAAPVEPSA